MSSVSTATTIPRESVQSGNPDIMGARLVEGGLNVAVFAKSAAELKGQVYICLFDDHDNEQRIPLHPPAPDANGTERDGVWHAFLPNVKEGQKYGLRVDAPYDPANGNRFNVNKLLIDPYATEVDRALEMHPTMLGYKEGTNPYEPQHINRDDSAPFMPKGVVRKIERDTTPAKTNIPWSDTIIYEAHVKGFTMKKPDVPDEIKGTFEGFAHSSNTRYLNDLGITTIETMPVQLTFEQTPNKKPNYWHYDPVNYFTPQKSMGTAKQYRDMTQAYDDAGIEIIQDVVYNHTGEGNEWGPTVSFRGLDNKAYYLLEQDKAKYRNYAGCGNTLNVNHPAVTRMAIDSLHYFVDDLKAKGFRFDLAATLGRADVNPDDANLNSHFYQKLKADPVLSKTKLAVEPWDLGANGQKQECFPEPFRQWGDGFRDGIRSFWAGWQNQLGTLKHQFSKFTVDNRHINFTNVHDGFTLADTCMYERKHNDANGEDNRDGNDKNFSVHFGVEGETTDPAVNELRKRYRNGMMTTLMLAPGVPLMLAGDEFYNSQKGNNNAYCQDNEISWLDWEKLQTPEGREQHLVTRDLIRKRKEFVIPQLQKGEWNIKWMNPAGREQYDWEFGVGANQCIGLEIKGNAQNGNKSLLTVFNTSSFNVEYKFPTEDNLKRSTAMNTSCHAALIGSQHPVSSAQSYIIAPHTTVIFNQEAVSSSAAEAAPKAKFWQSSTPSNPTYA